MKEDNSDRSPESDAAFVQALSHYKVDIGEFYSEQELYHILVNSPSVSIVDNNTFAKWSDIRGNTLLNHAARNGYFQIAEFLLARGADPLLSASDTSGNPQYKRLDIVPLMTAINFARLKLVELFLSYAKNRELHMDHALAGAALIAIARKYDDLTTDLCVSCIIDMIFDIIGADILKPFKMIAQETDRYCPILSHATALNDVPNLVVRLLQNSYAIDTHGEALNIAALGGNFAMVKIIVSNSIHLSTRELTMALIIVCASDSEMTLSTVHMLLECGASPSDRDELGNTAVSVAAHKCNLELLEILLQEGGDPLDGFEQAEGVEETILSLQCFNLLVDYLVKNSNDLDNSWINQDKDGIPIISLLAMKYPGSFLALAIEKGADIERKDTEDGEYRTPLDWACRMNNKSAAEVLLDAGANPNAWNGVKDGWTCLHTVVENGTVDFVDLIISSNADPNAQIKTDLHKGCTALHLAVARGDLDIVTLLVTKTHVDVNLRRDRNCTALLDAVVNATSDQDEKHISIVKLLLANKADPDLADVKLTTPLITAVEGLEVELVRLLVNADANIELKNDSGFNPLLLASDYLDIPKGVEIMKIMLHSQTKDMNKQDYVNTMMEKVKALVRVGNDDIVAALGLVMLELPETRKIITDYPSVWKCESRAPKRVLRYQWMDETEQVAKPNTEIEAPTPTNRRTRLSMSSMTHGNQRYDAENNTVGGFVNLNPINRANNRTRRSVMSLMANMNHGIDHGPGGFSSMQSINFTTVFPENMLTWAIPDDSRILAVKILLESENNERKLPFGWRSSLCVNPTPVGTPLHSAVDEENIQAVISIMNVLKQSWGMHHPSKSKQREGIHPLDNLRDLDLLIVLTAYPAVMLDFFQSVDLVPVYSWVSGLSRAPLGEDIWWVCLTKERSPSNIWKHYVQRNNNFKGLKKPWNQTDAVFDEDGNNKRNSTYVGLGEMKYDDFVDDPEEEQVSKRSSIRWFWKKFTGLFRKGYKMRDMLYNKNFKGFFDLDAGNEVQNMAPLRFEISYIEREVEAFFIPVKHFGTYDMLYACVRACNKLKNPLLFESRVMAAVVQLHWRLYGFRMHIYNVKKYFGLLLAFLILIFVYQDFYDKGGVAWAFVILLQIYKVVYSTFFVVQEIQQLKLAGSFSKYIQDPWNIIDIPAFSLLLCGVVWQSIDANSTYVDAIHGVTSLLLWFKVLYFMRPFSLYGPMVLMIFQVIFDIKVFLTILFIVMIGFGNAFYIILAGRKTGISCDDDNLILSELCQDGPGFQGPFNTVYIAIRSAFSYMLGNYDLSDLDEGIFPVLLSILWAIFMVIVTIILLNLLIAIISESYERVSANKNPSWRLEQARIIVNLYAGMSKKERASLNKLLLEYPWLHVLAPKQNVPSQKV